MWCTASVAAWFVPVPDSRPTARREAGSGKAGRRRTRVTDEAGLWLGTNRLTHGQGAGHSYREAGQDSKNGQSGGRLTGGGCLHQLRAPRLLPLNPSHYQGEGRVPTPCRTVLTPGSAGQLSSSSRSCGLTYWQGGSTKCSRLRRYSASSGRRPRAASAAAMRCCRALAVLSAVALLVVLEQKT